MTNLRFLPASAVLGLIVFASSPVMAQSWIQDFNSGSDSAWTRYNPFTNATFSLGDSAYRIQADPSPGAELGPGRAGSVLTGVTVSDFSVSVDLVNWDASLMQSFGVVARVNDMGLGATNGYFFNYSPGPSADRSYGELEISLFQGEERQLGAIAAVSLLTDLDSALDYRFVFTGVGSLLTGSVYALDDLETSLASVVLTDSTYLTGGVGLLVTDSNAFSPALDPLGSADATFDNFSVTAIPEPSTYAALTGLVGGLAAFWLRRKRVAVGNVNN